MYFNELILPSKPKVIVYCCGDNDIAVLEEKGVKNAVLGFQLFLEQIKLKAPSVKKILYLGIHPSPIDEPLWGHIENANTQLKKVCADNKIVAYVDYLHLLFDSKGKLIANCFKEDGLHFSPNFYKSFANYLIPLIKEKP